MGDLPVQQRSLRALIQNVREMAAQDIGIGEIGREASLSLDNIGSLVTWALLRVRSCWIINSRRQAWSRGDLRAKGWDDSLGAALR